MMRVICRFKILTIIVLSFFVLSSKGQVYQEMPQYGYRANRMAFDSTLSIPTVCGVPTLKSNITKKAAIAFDSCNGVFYQYNPKTLVWSQITGGGGGSTDTTSLSNRINLKLNISDTATMLSPYLRKSDTTVMLSKYLRVIDTSNKWVNSVTKLNDSTIRVIKGASTTDITLTPSTTVASATRLITTVYNNSGSTISKGSIIYINGRHSSNYPTIALAQANTEANSYSTFAMVQDDILNNNTGTVIQAGNISNLNLPTSTYTDGQLVYLSPTVAGGITTTKPLAPNHIVKIGTITRAHPTLGSIELKIENGWQLDELSDVQIALVPVDSTILQFSRVDSLWHDVNPTTAMGNRFVKVSDSSAMLSKYLRKTDTTNKFVNSITRIPGKDSIIFYVGSTRYAIKDSLASASGAAGPEYAVQYKNADGYMSGDANLTWIYQTQKLGIGTDDPQVTLDAVKGNKGNMPLNYETASFQKNGEVKVGVYNSDNYSSGTGAAFTLGNTKNLNANGTYPGFEFQNINDSAYYGNSYMRYNYLERDVSGTIVAANVDLLKIEANGTVRINPFSYGLSTSPRLIVGEDNFGATLETSGNAYINGRFITQSSRQKYVNYLNDDDIGTTYSVTNDDHIIIYATNSSSCTITLPEFPENGREFIIKHAGDYTTYNLVIDGYGHEFSEIGQTEARIILDQQPNAVTIVYYDGTWFLLTGQIEAV